MWPHPPAPGWYPDPRGIPGQAYWDGQQWQIPPAPRKKSPLKTLAIVGGAIFVAVAFTLVSPLGQKALNKSKSTQSSAQPSPSTAAPTQGLTEVKLNQEARDGNLAFLVTAVDTAQRMVNVHLTVKNVGNRPAVFWTDNQRLWIGERWFVPDKAAAAKAGTTSVKIEPGKSAMVVVAFGVPAGNTVVDSVELHDAAVSAGISVVPRP